MGIPSANTAAGAPAAGDQANYVIAGNFSGTGQSPIGGFYGSFNMVLYGGASPNTAWVGTVRLERSFDAGATWIVCGVGGGGQQASYNQGADISIVANEPEKGVLYRLNCTAYSSGTIFYRLSATGTAATAWGIAPG